MSQRNRDSISYNLSFTAASLRPELARIVAEVYLEVGDWAVAKERLLAVNALQCRTTSSAIRLEREIRQRLGNLTQAQLELLAHSPAEERTAMAWLATCKHTRFAFEFAAEVLRDKFATYDTTLRPSDYEGYVELKSLIHPELTQLSGSSKNKIRQVLVKMLSEAGLLAEGSALGVIQRPVLSPAVQRVILEDAPRWLAGFLVPDHEIGGLSVA